jgi:hypothetical protein
MRVNDQTLVFVYIPRLTQAKHVAVAVIVQCSIADVLIPLRLMVRWPMELALNFRRQAAVVGCVLLTRVSFTNRG